MEQYNFNIAGSLNANLNTRLIDFFKKNFIISEMVSRKLNIHNGIITSIESYNCLDLKDLLIKSIMEN